jgi:glycosyltransferase involved in cell wall biosynthesis
MSENITPHSNSAEYAHNPLEGNRPELNIKLHENTDEQVSIIIVHKDRPEYLNICLQSIAVTSFNNNYEIIVVDNGSGSESQEFLKDIEGEVKVVKNDKNLYWSAACNKGVQAADKNSKYFIFMHCDVVVLNPAWIDLLVNVSESQQSGYVGVDTQSYMMGNQKVDFLQEYVLLLTRDAWNDIGPWPEQLPQIGPAFIMTIKAQNMGHKPQIMKNQIVHHYKIFAMDISDFERMTEQAHTVLPKLLSDVQSRSL